MSSVSPETLTRLFNEHGAALVLYARQWCAAPEDVVQEGFLLLARQSVTPENPAGWLYRVVRNAAISASRSAGRRLRREAAAAHRGEPWFHAADDSRLDATTAARALEVLAPAEREVVVARIWGGLSFEEIAGLTGASISTVHRRYQAGLAALRERLGLTCPQKKNT
jgi:RNA polymerase sigma-70 factor (ECF subfamily)